MTNRLISLNAAIEAVDEKWPFDHKRHLLSTLRALPDAWQGIETAPRDCARVIGTDGTHVAAMTWEVECDDDEYTGWCGACSVDGGMLYYNHVELGFEPTHWMPLPEPLK